MKQTSNTNKGNITLEEDEEYDEDFSSKKDSSSTSKDVKNNDKASAIRSKHSVTEQRRRSKINERFQILRDLIPHGHQKRDTASFLLEVIEYVQILQEKIQKYEGSCQGWGTEPTKLLPWRHSHWRVQSYLSQSNPIQNGPASAIKGKFDDKGFNMNPSLTANVQALVDADSSHDAYRVLDQRSELGEKAESLSTSFQVHARNAVRNDVNDFQMSQQPAPGELYAPFVIGNDDQEGEHMIEGGTISISSAYSHGLLMTLTQALQNSGVDLSQASISIRIDIGKRANQSLLSGASGAEGLENPVSQDPKIRHIRDGSGNEESDQPHKRLRS